MQQTAYSTVNQSPRPPSSESTIQQVPQRANNEEMLAQKVEESNNTNDNEASPLLPSLSNTNFHEKDEEGHLYHPL